MSAVPGPAPSTAPLALTVAIETSLLVHVPPAGESERVIEELSHNCDGPEMDDTGVKFAPTPTAYHAFITDCTSGAHGPYSVSAALIDVVLQSAYVALLASISSV